MTGRARPLRSRVARTIIASAVAATLFVFPAGPGLEPAAATVLPPNVRPSLAAAAMDREVLWRDGCLSWEAATAPARGCVFGDPAGRIRVALVGDSHASAWFPAVEAVARARGWRLEVYVKVSCVFVDMPLYSRALGREYRECTAYRDATAARLRADPPDLLLVTASHVSIFPMRPADRTLAAEGAAFARMLERMPARRTVILADVPFALRDVPSCLAANRGRVEACAIVGWSASPYGAIERLAATATGATRIDLAASGWCGTTCPVVRDGIVAYRDQHHLTATFARSLAPLLARALDRAGITA